MMRISAPSDTMPIFTASGRISEKTASSSCPRNSGETFKMLLTPHVFWAVSAVTALMPNTPFIVIVLRSA